VDPAAFSNRKRRASGEKGGASGDDMEERQADHHFVLG
jgi:hypothetical protein